jgi:hypothetical protein
MDNWRTLINPASLSATITVVYTSNVTKDPMVTVLHFSRTVFIIGIFYLLDGFYAFAVGLTQVIFIL